MLPFNSFIKFIILQYPPDTGAGSAGIQDMVDLMGENDNPDETSEQVVPDQSADLLADDKPKDKETDKEDKKEDADKEPEIELEEPELTDDELDASSEDVPRREILKKYPTIFKDFPQLEKAYYREQKYAEIVPTIEDAKVAVEKAQTYDNFETSVLKGSVEQVLSSVKQASPESYARIIDNLLPNIQKIDREAYYHIIGNVTKNLIVGMAHEGNKIQNDALKNAAVILNQFIFGSSNFEPAKPFAKDADKPNEEQEAIKAERQALVQERFNTTLEDVSSRAQNTVRSTISKHIDPKNMMTDYVRRIAVQEALDDVEKLIENDPRFRAQQDKLWERAMSSKFSRESSEALVKAYLNKARTLLPQSIQKSRNAALKGLGKRVADEREEPTRKGPVTVGRSTSAENRSTKAGEVPKGMKTLDYLMSD